MCFSKFTQRLQFEQMIVTLEFEEESFQYVLKALANERDRDRAYRHSGAADVLSRAVEQIKQHCNPHNLRSENPYSPK